MWIRSPKVSSAMHAGRIMLKPRSARSRSSPRQKEVDAGLRVEVWGPVAIASRIVASGQGGPTSAGQPCVAYSWSNSVAGWGVPAGDADSVRCCFLRKNVLRQGACCISAAVVMARERRGPRRETPGMELSLPSRLKPLMEPGRPCWAPRRERPGKGQSLPLRLGLFSRPRRAQGQLCRDPRRERQGKG